MKKGDVASFFARQTAHQAKGIEFRFGFEIPNTTFSLFKGWNFQSFFCVKMKLYFLGTIQAVNVKNEKNEAEKKTEEKEQK